MTGALYAIIGVGLILGYQTAGIFNFGYGAIAFAAAYLYYQLNTGQHLPIVWSALITVLVFAPLMGLVLERILLRRLANAPVYARIVGTIGLVVALPNLALWIVSLINSAGGNLPTNESVTTAPGLGPTPATYFHPLAGVVIDSDQIAILAAAMVSAAGLWFLLRHTRLGLAMRANVDRPELAQLRGISPARVSRVAWVLISVLAGLVGVLIVPLFGLDPNTFTLVVLGSIAAVVFGGLRSLPLVFVGGLLLGVIQNMVAGYANSFLPPSVAQLSGLLSSVPFVLAVVGLIILDSITRRRTRNPISEDPQPDHRDGLSVLRRRLPWIVLTAALVLYTLILANSYWAALLAQGLVFSIIFLSFVVATGMGGMVSLCQATFVTAGGFFCGWLVTHRFHDDIPGLMSHGHLNFGVATLAAALGTAVVGMGFAVVVRRLGTLLLALATLALGFTCELVFFNINAISGGSTGYSVNAPSVGSFLNFTSPRALTLLLLAVFGLITLLIYNIRRSASGRAIFAARSTEIGARSAGLSPDRIRVLMFAFSPRDCRRGGCPLHADVEPVWEHHRADRGRHFLAGRRGDLRDPTAGGCAVGRPLLLSRYEPLRPILELERHDSLRHPVALFSPDPLRNRCHRAGQRAGRHPRPECKTGRQASGVVEHEDGATPEKASLLPTSFTGSPESPSDPVSVPAAEARHPSSSAPRGDDPPSCWRSRTSRRDTVRWRCSTAPNFEVREGSIVALLGANGAGKTTLCRAATGFISPSKGRVLHRGRDITASPPHQRALDGILSSPEGRGVFPGLSVEENLSVWLPSDELRSRAFDHFPILGDRRRQMAGLLSGGEQQMLSLVPALVRPPDLFIADEPTLGLAPLGRRSGLRDPR